MEIRKPKNVYTESDTQLFPWVALTSPQQIDILIRESENQCIAIFKHSTRCAISKRVLSNFEKEWDFSENVTFYYLDLIAYRAISNEVAERLGVEHESPQLIVLNNGKVIYQESHSAISASEVAECVKKLEQ